MLVRLCTLIFAVVCALPVFSGASQANPDLSSTSAPIGAVAAAKRWYVDDPSPSGAVASYVFLAFEFNSNDAAASIFAATVSANAVTTDHYIGEVVDGPSFADQSVWISGVMPLDESTELNLMSLFALDQNYLYSWVGTGYLSDPRPLMEQIAAQVLKPVETRMIDDLADRLPSIEEMPEWFTIKADILETYDGNGNVLSSATPVPVSPENK